MHMYVLYGCVAAYLCVQVKSHPDVGLTKENVRIPKPWPCSELRVSRLGGLAAAQPA